MGISGKSSPFRLRAKAGRIAAGFLVALLCFFPAACYFGDATEVDQENIYIPDINIRGGTVVVDSGGSYDYGSVNVSSSLPVTFWVENLGRGYLHLSGTPHIEISGTDASMFVVDTQPANIIAPYAYRSFNITFTPASSGIKTAVVTIKSDDPDETSYSFTVQGTGTVVTAPDISILDPLSATINNSTGSYDFGNVDTLTPSTKTFTIKNNGTAPLNLTGSSPYVTIGGIDSGLFSVTAAASTPIGAGGSTTFDIKFAPTSAGVKNATVTIANNDSTKNPYTFALTGTGVLTPVAKMEVRQGVTLLPSNVATVYDFGSVNQGVTSSAVTFTINNIGNAALNLTGGPTRVSVTGTEFVVTADATTPVNPGVPVNFTMTFTPSTAGPRTATVTIAYHDSIAPGTYTFTVNGTGVAIPEMDLFQGVTPIASVSGSYGFGSTVAGTPKAATFTINNTGNGVLSLPGNPIVAITPVIGTGAFSVTALPVVSVAASGSTTFDITLNSTIVGSYTALVSIANNDLNEDPYTFTISGTTTAVALPMINVLQGTSEVLNGGTYDVGGMTIGGTAVDTTFTIANVGSANLNLTAASPYVTIGGPDAAMFSIVAPFATTPVAAAGSTNFTVRFNATGTGTRTATISIANNDTDQNPYTFTITGTGTQPSMSLQQAATTINVGDTFDFNDVDLTTSKQLTFNIQNLSATSALLLKGSPKIQITGTAEFNVVSQPSSDTVAPSGSAPFVVRYTPAGAGSDSVSVSIANNDTTKNPYTFTLTARGVDRNIQIRDNSDVTVIAHTGTFDFLNVKYNSPYVRTFYIHNTGTVGDIQLKSTPYVVVAGPNASFFTVTAQPGSGTLTPGTGVSFQITFNQGMSSSAGLKTATVYVYSNDPDTPVYSFTVQGTVTVPVIGIYDPSLTYIPPAGGPYVYPNVNFGSAGVARTFTINNTGTASLDLTGAPYVQLSGAGAADFTVTTQPSSPVAGTIPGPAGSTTFVITYSPVTAPNPTSYTSTATVTVASDDPVNGTYTFTVQGTCVDTQAPTVSVTSPPAGTPQWRGTHNLTATASDNVTVAQVRYYLDGVTLLGSSATGPNYTVSLDTTLYSDGAHTIVAQADDLVPNTGTSAAVSFVIDNTPPTISISGPSVAIAKNGTTVTYTVTYSDTNFNSSTLAAGDITLGYTGTAAGASVTAVNVISATQRQVVITTGTGDGTVYIASIAAGTASDIAGNTAPAAGPSTAYTVDNTPPTINISAPSVTSAKNGATVTYTVTYADANFSASTLAAGNITVNTTGTATGTVTAVNVLTATTREVVVTTGAGDGTLGISIAAGTASDTAGNTAPAAGPSTTFIVDNTPPTISIGAPSVTVAKSGTTVSYTVTYADANFSASTLAVGNITVNTTGTAAGTVTAVNVLTATTREVVVTTGAGDGTLGISIAAGTASDTAGNTAPAAGPSTTYDVDNTPPTITISAPSATVAKNGTTVSYTVTYADANFSASTLAAGNVTVNTTGTATGTVTAVNVLTATTREVVVTTGTGDGTLSISIAAGTASDTLGNTSLAAGPSTTYDVDNTGPTVTIGVPSTTIAKSGATVTYTVTYADANFNASTLAAGDITLGYTGTAAGASVTAVNVISATQRQVVITAGTGDGTVYIASIAVGTASDTLGNTSLAAGPGTAFEVDNTPPTITISAPSPIIAKNGAAVTYTVTYADANFDTTTLGTGDVSVNTTGTATGTVTAVNVLTATTCEVIVTTGAGDGTLGISIAAGTASDTAGNTAPAAGPSTTYDVDNTPPTITISAPSVTIAKSGTTVSYTVTYADANFSASTLAAGNVTVNTTGTAAGTVTAVNVLTATTREVVVTTGAGDGTLGISIAAGTASDTAGNTAPAAGPSTTYDVDNTPPTITISAPSATVAKNGTTVSYTVTYADANFSASTLAAGNVTVNTTGTAAGTVTAVNVLTATTREVVVTTGAGDGTLGISIAAGTASDTAGNTAPAAGPSTTYTVDNTPPTVTIDNPAAGSLVVAGSQIFFTVSDGTITARIDASAYQAAASGNTFGSLNGWATAGAAFNVDVQSVDTAGNTGSASRNFTK